jgi:hypothetical protein
MPIESPRLDTLSFASVEAMLRARIPVVAPDWTDHNDSDPGIALIQLFAHLSEQIGYRLNRVPEKTYVEFLKLVGVKLRPASPARTRLAFVLDKPDTTNGLVVPAGAQARSRVGDPAPVFETDAPTDIVPAQVAALVTARADLFNINGDDGGPTAEGADPKTYVAERYSLAWNGKAPKLKDWPTQPVLLFSRPTEKGHTELYIGLAFNQTPQAGFLGSRVSLHLQIDSDEAPEPDASVRCGETPLTIVSTDEEPMVQYRYLRPPSGAPRDELWPALHVLSDETNSWTRSGVIRMQIPAQIGPAPLEMWADVEPEMPHPLLGAVKTPLDRTPAEAPISGWLRVTFKQPVRLAIRSLSFNTAGASHLTTVGSEPLGPGDDKPGQTFKLRHPNVSPASLSVVSRDPAQDAPPAVWRVAGDFDDAGPDDRVCVLDAEAGILIFGSGERGRPPAATDYMYANGYRHGGGASGDVPTGAVALPVTLPGPIGSVVNIVPARGGRDAETLEAAKERAPRAFSMRRRAVTAQDFEEAAVGAPGVRIARANVVPLRRPYPQGHMEGGVIVQGVDFRVAAPGALTVLVVPQSDSPYPMPTAGEMRAVAAHLESLRLLTTEVHVAAPQYVRVFDFEIVVRAAAGYTTTGLREALTDLLSRRLHILKGGPDGRGYPFGGSLHHSDLVAAVMSEPGVTRVEALFCNFDGRSPKNAERPFFWRAERQETWRLTNCPAGPEALETDRITLNADEVFFVDAASMVITVEGPS